MVIKKNFFCIVVGVFLSFLLCACRSREADFVILEKKEETAVPESSEEQLISCGEMQSQIGTDAAVIYVYVCGAVNQPGVYALPLDSRVEAALNAAGGFLEEAEINSVNLAAILKDGDKIFFPTKEQAQELLSAEGIDGLININTASVEVLCTLPGIGETRAADIVAYRESKGNFRAAEDIMKVSGIKESIYEKIKDKICVR